MNDTELMEKMKHTYLDAISETSVQFIGFVESPQWVRQMYLGEIAFDAEEIAQLNITNVPFEARMNWIAATLKRLNISGEFLFSFSNLPFAHVVLDDSYEWVGLIWQRMENFSFIPLDHSYLLIVRWTEFCFGDNCYSVRLFQRPAATG
jgi:hypothetical protein